MEEEKVVYIIVGQFAVNENLYNNMKEDLSNCVLYIGEDKEVTYNLFEKLVKQEKEKSWIKDLAQSDKEIEYEENKSEFFYRDSENKKYTHLQVVRKLLNIY